jgi:hypothetical protein
MSQAITVWSDNGLHTAKVKTVRSDNCSKVPRAITVRCSNFPLNDEMLHYIVKSIAGQKIIKALKH